MNCHADEQKCLYTNCDNKSYLRKSQGTTNITHVWVHTHRCLWMSAWHASIDTNWEKRTQRQTHKFSVADLVSSCRHYLAIAANYQSTWGRLRLNNLGVQRKNQQRDIANYIRKIPRLWCHQSIAKLWSVCVFFPSIKLGLW